MDPFKVTTEQSERIAEMFGKRITNLEVRVDWSDQRVEAVVTRLIEQEQFDAFFEMIDGTWIPREVADNVRTIANLNDISYQGALVWLIEDAIARRVRNGIIIKDS